MKWNNFWNIIRFEKHMDLATIFQADLYVQLPVEIYTTP